MVGNREGGKGIREGSREMWEGDKAGTKQGGTGREREGRRIDSNPLRIACYATDSKLF